MKITFSVRLLFAKAPDYVSLDETGERHTFLATSSRYPAKAEYEKSDSLRGDAAVSEDTKAQVAVGSTGVRGSGVYTVDEACEAGDESVQKILEDLRRQGIDEKVWSHLRGQISRVTGDK